MPQLWAARGQVLNQEGTWDPRGPQFSGFTTDPFQSQQNPFNYHF